jgi:uncharacterized protein YndB with AHSA1/START domain
MSKLTLRTYHVFDAAADKVWALLADFGAIDRWWPTEGPIVIERVEVEGQGPGMVRHIFNRGARYRVSERLERLDSIERVLQLTILNRDSVPWYLATARLIELEDGRCRLDYESEFSAPSGRENQTRDGILAAYAVMFRGLQDAAR